MPLDPQAKAVLERTQALGLPPQHTLTPQEARIQAEARQTAAPGEPVDHVEDRVIAGPAGDLPVRIYRPAGGGPFPALVFLHGGGWVVGSLAGADAACRAFVNRAGCVAVSVDYRLAPEHKFPASVEDVYAALRWVATQAASIGADPSRIAIGGFSAGGNLAAAGALLARDRGGPALAFQLLCYPITDRNFETASYRDNGNGFQLSREGMIWYWNHYLGTEADADSPYASTLRAEDLSGLPPALVITAEYDPLRDEAEAYASRLRQAGVPVTCTRYDGMMHGFMGMAAVLDKGQQAIEEAGAALRTRLQGRGDRE